MKYEKDLIIRISTALLLIVLPFNLFFFLFSKITFLSSLPFLHILNQPFSVKGFKLVFEGRILNFVSACVASSAYYLLALLILLTKNMKLKERLLMFVYGALLIFAMNVIRIDILLGLLIKFGQNWFERLHLLFWNFVSSAYVAAVWIFLTFKFKVKSIPVYSDLRYLFSKSMFKKKPRKKKKS